ncbi:MAG: hypothetical protein QM784_11110 [Polyangiaceae bacterium]
MEARKAIVARRVAVVLSVAFGLLSTTVANAYPTSVIFAPTAETLDFIEAGVNVYVPLDLRPRVQPSATWIGADLGVLPALSYGAGWTFGGAEVGIDMIDGAEHVDGTSYAKPIFNAKLNLLAQREWVPALGIGLMSFAPFQAKESVNFTYVAATKELVFGGTSAGELTVGMGCAIGAQPESFSGSFPFRNGRWAWLAGYVSPEWHRLSVALDTLGGTSEASATSFALNFAPSDGSYIMLGAYFSNDRTLPNDEIFDGVFSSLGLTIPFASTDDAAE